MKTIYYTAASLDGFLADEAHGLDWLFQFGEAHDTGYHAFIKDVGALAMGAHTYEWLLRNHIKPGQPDAQPWPYEQPTWVFSRRQLPTLPGANMHFVQGDVRPVHAAMAQAAGGKNIWLVGGGELAGCFLDAGLLDEILVTVASVTLGRGFPLLPRRQVAKPLQLLRVQQFGADFVQLNYRIQKG